VRVHASMLRKRLDQYFAGEGAGETTILEIPKGNYAPVFRERPARVPEAPALEPPPAEVKRNRDFRLLAAVTLAAVFAATTVILIFVGPPFAKPSGAAEGAATRRFWSGIFRADQATDVVLDDAAIGLYQELTDHPLMLGEYYDHSYLRGIPGVASGAGLDAQAMASMALRRQSSYADASFLWKLLQFGGNRSRHTNLRFARDYAFRDLKSDNAILLGNSRSNPWVQAFEPKLGLRWQFDKAAGVYYPVDTWQGGRSYLTGQRGAGHDGYFSIALLPNLGGTGNVMLLSATGGSAVSAAAEFLSDERGLSELLQRLPKTGEQGFPAFEALVRTKTRSSQPHDVSVVLCRPAGK